jgi:hypothetical protein
MGINNRGFIHTGNGNDIITGTSSSGGYIGINNARDASINTGDGDDTITAFGTGDAIVNNCTIAILNHYQDYDTIICNT